MTDPLEGLDAYLQGYADGLAALGEGPLVRVLRRLRDGDVTAVAVVWVDQDDETGGYYRVDGREVTLLGCLEEMKCRILLDGRDDEC